MRWFLLGSCLSLGLLVCLSSRGQAQNYGSGPSRPARPTIPPPPPHIHTPPRPIPVHTTPPRHTIQPQPGPASSGGPNPAKVKWSGPPSSHGTPRPTTRPPSVSNPLIGKAKASSRPAVPRSPVASKRPVVVGKTDPVASKRPAVVGKTGPVASKRPVVVGKSGPAVTTRPAVIGTTGTTAVLTRPNQLVMQNALQRLGAGIRGPLLLAALRNLASGQPLNAAQCGSLSQYLNSPGCGLSMDEQNLVQQCIGQTDPTGPDDTTGPVGPDDTTGPPPPNNDDTPPVPNEDDTPPVPNEDPEPAPDEGGVLVSAVQEESAAARGGLRAGDTILSFGEVRTRTFEELQDAVGQARGPVKVVFRNGENGEIEFLTVEPEDGRIGVTCE